MRGPLSICDCCARKSNCDQNIDACKQAYNEFEARGCWNCAKMETCDLTTLELGGCLKWSSKKPTKVWHEPTREDLVHYKKLYTDRAIDVVGSEYYSAKYKGAIEVIDFMLGVYDEIEE